MKDFIKKYPLLSAVAAFTIIALLLRLLSKSSNYKDGETYRDGDIIPCNGNCTKKYQVKKNINGNVVVVEEKCYGKWAIILKAGEPRAFCKC